MRSSARPRSHQKEKRSPHHNHNNSGVDHSPNQERTSMPAVRQAFNHNDNYDDDDDKLKSPLSDLDRKRLNFALAAILVFTLVQVISYYTGGTVPTPDVVASIKDVETANSLQLQSKSLLQQQQQPEQQPLNVSKEELALHPTLPPAKRLKVPYPIFVASFSKSGTTSTYYAFSCYLGQDYVAHRWTTSAHTGTNLLIGRCIELNVEANRPPFEGCGTNYFNQTQTVVWTDTQYLGGPNGCYNPQLQALDQIYEAYPTATILLVKRNATQWFQSANTRRASFIPKWASKCRDMPKGRKQSVWVDFYHNFTRHMQQFAQAHPSLTYVEVELENPNTGKILQDKMGLPESCWQHCLSSFTMTKCRNITQDGDENTKPKKHEKLTVPGV